MHRNAVWIGVVFLAGASGAAAPNVAELIERSSQAIQADWKADPQYNYFERDAEGDGTKTYHVWMIGGSPYQQLVEVNGKPLPAADQEKSRRELEKEKESRARESAEKTQSRIESYKKDRERNFELIQQLTKAFDFKLGGEETVGKHQTWVLEATPKPGYHPPDKRAEVLTGMQGKLWIDKPTYQWVKVEAEVVRPVSIEGFLARVEPGTRFELEKTPVAPGIWLPSHFSVHAKAKILDIFGHDVHTDETYYDYQKAVK
jgi:hypothetical protein